MKIHIKLYSGLRAHAPGDENVFTLALDGAARVGDALARLGIPAALDCVMILDGRRANRETLLKDGGELVLFSVISGG